VVSRDEAVARVRAAADARDEGADILVVARTDARQAISLEVRPVSGCVPLTDALCLGDCFLFCGLLTAGC
jgi:2-methylisocitrate lyase-like PEP mutase family enzyme